VQLELPSPDARSAFTERIRATGAHLRIMYTSHNGRPLFVPGCKGRLASCGALRDTAPGMSTNGSHLQLPPAQVAEFCQRHHIRKLALFGSALHGDARPDSDLDVLVEFEPGHVPGLVFFAME